MFFDIKVGNRSSHLINDLLIATNYIKVGNQKLSKCSRHEVAKASVFVAEEYKQHNPEVPNGKQPFVSFFKGYFKDYPQSQARII